MIDLSFATQFQSNLMLDLIPLGMYDLKDNKGRNLQLADSSFR